MLKTVKVTKRKKKSFCETATVKRNLKKHDN